MRLDDLDSYKVLCRFAMKRHERRNIPSLSGRDDTSRSTAGPSGEFESLCGLTRGVDERVLKAFELRCIAMGTIVWVSRPLETNYLEEGEWQYRDEDPNIELQHQVAKAATWDEVATRMGLQHLFLRRLVARGLMVVEENLGNARHRERLFKT